ncbi:MAG: aureocin A53 family class IId bacteriocin [Scardovia wiggsiae]|uniref:aureocin A53 family class IId bacteriocin n=1 Tax=Scardovia wiggsiae TaxID=230143 RepID=UPI0003607C98|nr:aureocin A53 family class IId bacteriocin [Scardovia wiggsiae]MBF1677313.1 aureocin A53 family class IId bacteriocin [Scardovia wiggsiae]
MGAFFRLLSILARYGARAVQWAWAHRGTVLRWIGAGQAIDWVIKQIKRLLGIR